ncbi:MAG TPA: ChbG/HpnK family deacetylase [Lacipirellula sp.]
MNRLLIVNADDFGLSEGVNRGILRAQREGILTSASLMVRGPAAAHAAESAEHLGLGLHIDLGEWAYRDGEWVTVYERVPTNDADAVEQEIREQLALFQQLTGKLPTHLDSHQHIHRQEPVRKIARRLASELHVPLRGFDGGVRYCGSFYGQTGKGRPCPSAIGAESLVWLIRTLPPGITELGCHPGNDPMLTSAYRMERMVELASLCHPRVRAAVDDEDIQLATFADLHMADPVARSGAANAQALSASPPMRGKYD